MVIVGDRAVAVGRVVALEGEIGVCSIYWPIRDVGCHRRGLGDCLGSARARSVDSEPVGVLEIGAIGILYSDSQPIAVNSIPVHNKLACGGRQSQGGASVSVSTCIIQGVSHNSATSRKSCAYS